MGKLDTVERIRAPSALAALHEQPERYMPQLDGLRALGALGVLVYHTGVPGLLFGFLGLDLFFVLSGYLITTILMRQIQSGGIELKQFYLRRLVRLYPALLVAIALSLILIPISWPHSYARALMAALYVADYTGPFTGEPRVLGHTWSLSIEEHYYLIWPLLLPFVLKAKKPAAVMVAAYVVATLWRIESASLFGWQMTYFRFDARLSGLILGGLIAIAPWNVGRKELTAAILFAAVSLWIVWGGKVPLGLSMTAAEIAAACLVLCAANGRLPALQAPTLIYLGRISYGIYLYHFVIMCAIPTADISWQLKTAIVLPATFVVAAFSFHFVERPTMEMGRRRIPAITQSCS